MRKQVKRKQVNLQIRDRIEEIRGNLKTRVEEWKERGWRAPETQREPLFPRIKEIREKGLARMRGQRKRGMRGQRGRGEEVIEPAFPKDMLVKKEEEIRPTVGKREIAIEL